MQIEVDTVVMIGCWLKNRIGLYAIEYVHARLNQKCEDVVRNRLSTNVT